METKKITQLAMLLALAIVLNIIENIIPVFSGFIPGAKIGIANIIILFVLYAYSFKDALYVSILRVFLVGILLTGIFSPTFFFSASGAILSVTAMYLVKEYTKLSIIGVSIVGAIFHSIGQILVAIIILNTNSVIYYLPWLLLFSLPSGIFVGIIAKNMLNRFKSYCQN
jgi:heptaprenyl diphosphate synthase